MEQQLERFSNWTRLTEQITTPVLRVALTTRVQQSTIELIAQNHLTEKNITHGHLSKHETERHLHYPVLLVKLEAKVTGKM